MSRASAQVKFPDGTIKHGIYNGTVDVYWKYLFNNSEEAWSAWKEYYSQDNLEDRKWADAVKYEQVDGPFYDVEIADDYGGGDCYIGRATPRSIVSATKVDYMNRKGNGGKPDWWVYDESDVNA